jgi:tRNA threonylcarbamoyladenosine biosynthesis protein TsaE
MKPSAAASTALTLESDSPPHTERIGRALMDLLPDGALVALYGDLGAGKTCFVRGMAEAIGAARLVTSPTFTIVHEYPGSRPLYHLDLYRITDPRQVLDLGYEELFTPKRGVCVVEWADRAESLLPESRAEIRLAHASGDRRRIEVQNYRTLPEGWQRRLRDAGTISR